MKVTASIALFLAVLVLPTPAQQKRPTPAPPPTFETLLAADSYKVYGEVRGVGQLVRSNSVSEILEPIMKLADPPKEFKTLVKWLNAHADQLMTSRMLVAGWPTARGVPPVLVAIEFASAEEAAKFQPRLNEFLPKVLPAHAPQSPPESPEKPATPPQPNYYVKQAGSLILITPTPLNLKKLKPAGSKLLSEDANFRIARNRFNSESVFVFVDVNAIEKEEEERTKQSEEANRKIAETAAAHQEIIESANLPPAKDLQKLEPPELTDEERAAMEAQVTAQLGSVSSSGEAIDSRAPSQMFGSLFMLAAAFSNAQPKWPEALGFALSLESDSFDVRALMINAPGEKSDAVPFFPLLIPGPAFVPESPNILPADTEMVVTMSLDWAQIYSALSKLPPTFGRGPHVEMQRVEELEFEPAYAALEKQLKIKIKDDLLPLLGSEVVLSLPMKDFYLVRPPGPPPPAIPTPAPVPNANETAAPPFRPPAPVIAISLKDKDGMRRLLPKILESLGFKGVNSLAQTQRHGDTELISFANVFAYAFIGNFLVVSADAAATRHVVESYLKHETLSSDAHFKNYTRWQPRQLQGQIYVSPALMEGYRSWVQQPTTVVDDQTRAFLTRLSIVAQPVTYSLSNEGFGPLHELHLPKNLVLMFVAGISGARGTGQPIK
jgi:hypothetical protein